MLKGVEYVSEIGMVKSVRNFAAIMIRDTHTMLTVTRFGRRVHSAYHFQKMIASNQIFLLFFFYKQRRKKVRAMISQMSNFIVGCFPHFC